MLVATDWVICALIRAIRHLIENPLSSRIIGGDFNPGDTIVVDRAGDTL